VTVVQTIGEFSVSATSPGLMPVTFTLAGLDPCDFENGQPISLGTTRSGRLEFLDCSAHGGQLHDLYWFTLASQQAVLMRLHSPDFDPTLELFPPAYWYLSDVDTVNASRNAEVKAILPAGTYGLVASANDFAATGSYELGLSVTPQSAEACEFVLTFTGIGTTQNLASTDCPASSANRFEDRFALIIEGGETVTVTETSTAYAPYLQFELQGEVVAESNGSASGTATITFSSDTTAFYFIHASSVLEAQQGAYSLSVSSTYISISRTAGRRTITGAAFHRSIHDHVPAVSPH
jgi:hypothetical protein